jgi:taurine transport system permease protein
VGDTEFTYTLRGRGGTTDDATVHVRVYDFGEETRNFEVDPGAGIAKDDAVAMTASRSTTIIFDKNDEVTRKEGAKVVAIDGTPIGPDGRDPHPDGAFHLTEKGAISFTPPTGLQMEPIWLPPPEDVVGRV